MTSYNLELSNFLDFKKMERRDLLNDINRIGSIEKIEESSIVNYIKNLPKEIQKKIYIYLMKIFIVRILKINHYTVYIIDMLVL